MSAMRLRADFWVAAYLRRCEAEGASAYLRRRGAPEAGAVLVKLDRLDGRAAVFGMTSLQGRDAGVDRCFTRLHRDEWIDPVDAEARLKRESGFDPDLWIVEVEDRDGRAFLEIVEA